MMLLETHDYYHLDIDVYTSHRWEHIYNAPVPDIERQGFKYSFANREVMYKRLLKDLE